MRLTHWILVTPFFILIVHSYDVPCDVRAQTESGWVCGLRRWSDDGQVYASFRGVPYAKQPIGELRFKELQPAEHWEHDLDARGEGPVCPQHDEVYGYLTQQDYGMSEACIHANIHVPLYALPKQDEEHNEKYSSKKNENKEGNKDISNKNNKNKDDINNLDDREDKSDLDDDWNKKEFSDNHWPVYSWYKQDRSEFYSEHETGFQKGGAMHIFNTWPKFREQNNYAFSRNRYKRNVNKEGNKDKKLPVLVLIHGGGFNAGSGDADVSGPEYLVSKDVIVITFNYRINIFGYLSLNTFSVPGNNGLRDAITLLNWVQRNVKNFGGDPDNVTLMGHSAGSTNAHLLSLSDAAKGLFKRGTAYEAYYTASPLYTATVTASFLAILGITTVDPEEIHQKLIRMPIKRLIEANFLLQAQYGLITFSPVIESKFAGVKRIIDKDPEMLIAEGRGKEYPVIIGCTTNEVEAFRRRLDYENYVSRVTANPRLFLPANIPFTTPPNVSLALGEKIQNRCFEHLKFEDGHEPSKLDGLVKCYSDIFFIYQAFRLARERAYMNATPTYLYQFSYEGDFNAVKEGLKLEYKGTAHIEDFTYVFRPNALLDSRNDFHLKDGYVAMADWMTSFVVNFMRCSDPTCSKNKDNKSIGWPPVPKDHILYENIERPYVYKVTKPTEKQSEMIQFYDKIYDLSKMTSLKETRLPDH